jgi:hypothetical protein
LRVGSAAGRGRCLVAGVLVWRCSGIILVLESALDDLGLGATAGAVNSHDVDVIGRQGGLQLRLEGVRSHGGVYVQHRALVIKSSCIDGFLEKNRNGVDDESVDVGDSVVVDEVQLLVVEALDCRESLFHDAGYCLVLGLFDLQ